MRDMAMCANILKLIGSLVLLAIFIVAGRALIGLALILAIVIFCRQFKPRDE